MKLIWVHADCLHPASAAFAAYPGSPAIFVWDEQELARAGWTLKRIAFIYECLLELPVTIRRGDPVREVKIFAAEMGCAEIVTMATPDPRLREQAATLHAETLYPEPFVVIQGHLDLTRFSRYWRKAERALMD